MTDNPYIPKKYKVLEYYRESPDNFTITVDMKCNHSPGQFVQLSLLGIGEAPISICSDSRKYLKLNIREVGRVTSSLAGLKEGDEILIRGPYGNGYPMEDLKGNNLIIIGGGCGVAPLKGVIDYVENHRDDYKEVHLVLGYRSPKDILFQREIEQWKNSFHFKLTVDQNPHGEFCYEGRTGFVTEPVKEANWNNLNKIVFLCGPPVMMREVLKILYTRGFNDDQIYLSTERLMYCAVGLCCHCMIKGKLTCLDGPVFRYDRIKESLESEQK
jgi:anaerobic sulfite reductase subunit B